MITLIEPRVVIGSRYTRGLHVVNHDIRAGTYEEVNSPIRSASEARVQHALLSPAPSNLDRLWNQKRP